MVTCVPTAIPEKLPVRTPLTRTSVCSARAGGIALLKEISVARVRSVALVPYGPVNPMEPEIGNPNETVAKRALSPRYEENKDIFMVIVGG